VAISSGNHRETRYTTLGCLSLKNERRSTPEQCATHYSLGQMHVLAFLYLDRLARPTL
jgi:hypothetical protein